MHFFGTLGVLSFLIGTAGVLWILGEKIYDIAYHIHYERDVTSQPLFYISLVAVVVGFQLFLTGFVAELVSRNSPDRNNYQVEKLLPCHLKGQN